jgi:hypothetical protein
MTKLFQIGLITLCFLLNACTNQQEDAAAFTDSMLASHERAVENLEENTNIALSQTKYWLENPAKAQFTPIAMFAEQVDATITEIQLSISKTQLLLEQGASNAKLQEPYLRLRTQLEELEQKLNNNYQQFLSQYQQDFSISDEKVAIKIENFSAQVSLLDESWRSLSLQWSSAQFKLMLAKTNLDLATVKNWIINDLNTIFGGRSF